MRRAMARKKGLSRGNHMEGHTQRQVGRPDLGRDTVGIVGIRSRLRGANAAHDRVWSLGRNRNETVNQRGSTYAWPSPLLL